MIRSHAPDVIAVSHSVLQHTVLSAHWVHLDGDSTDQPLFTSPTAPLAAACPRADHGHLQGWMLSGLGSPNMLLKLLPAAG